MKILMKGKRKKVSSLLGLCERKKKQQFSLTAAFLLCGILLCQHRYCWQFFISYILVLLSLVISDQIGYFISIKKIIKLKNINIFTRISLLYIKNNKIILIKK